MRRLVIIGVPVIVLASFVFLYFTAEDIAAKLPQCLFLKYTGMYCPGCGSTRAVLSVLHGRFIMALRYNLGLCALAVICVLCYFEYVLNKKILPRSPWFWIVFGIILVLYYVFRNFISFF